MLPETLNLNSAQCIKEATYFGHITYTNICNGQTSIVPWGGADWAATCFLVAIGVGLLLFMLSFAVMIARD